MSKPLTIKLARGERAIAAVPEYCAGPGWANSPIVVHIVGNDGKHRQEYLQPEEQTPEQRMLFKICEEAHGLMLATLNIKRARS